VSPTHRPPLPPGDISRQLKILMIPPGIEPATSRLTAQCLNRVRHCVPPADIICRWNYSAYTAWIQLVWRSVTANC
jgi:hypothetical protein